MSTALLFSRRRGATLSPSISVTSSSGSTSITASGTGTVTFTLTRSGGFTGTVTPSAAGLPTGVTASFSPTTFGAGVTSMTMTLTGSSAPTVTNDAYTITFSGSGVPDAVYNGTVTVTASGTFAENLPAGLTLYVDTQFATEISSASANAEGLGTVDFYRSGLGLPDEWQTGMSGQPDGNTTAYQESFPPLDDGTNSGNYLYANHPAAARLYIARWHFLSSDYVHHTVEEKDIYPTLSIGGANVLMGWYLERTGDSATTTGSYGFFTGRGGDVRQLAPDNAPRIQRGVWQKIEVFMQMNTPNNANGIVRVWIGGTLALERTNVQFYDGGTQRFWNTRIDAGRGGGASAVLTPNAVTFRRTSRLAIYYATTVS